MLPRHGKHLDMVIYWDDFVSVLDKNCYCDSVPGPNIISNKNSILLDIYITLLAELLSDIDHKFHWNSILQFKFLTILSRIKLVALILLWLIAIYGFQPS